MHERDFHREINGAWDLLKRKLNIGRTLIWGRSLPIDEVFRNVVLSPEAPYEQIFKTGLSRSSYNILLEDYAFYQFNWVDDDTWRARNGSPATPRVRRPRMRSRSSRLRRASSRRRWLRS